MNQCAIHPSAFSTCEEIRSPVSDRRDSVVCPKPRRLGLLNVTANDHPVRSLRWQISHQAELCDSKAGTDLLEIILTKGGCGVEQSYTQVASSPPFFCGSPPSRVANPLIQDARFGDEKFSPISPLMPMPILPPSGLSSSPTSSTRKGGCVRSNFGNKPAVRVEGFDCLDRDSRNCSIPTLA
ncbi:uncharacterized protein LOC110600264 [Manihot esculenta]|uniref:Uncharacterized protein n=3 Tax=Manihot esculenta TaxID=3983 RepID=A0A2C9UKI0_MANES|nr:uncharacterized protein LOC110600264 [Manihot esculenta]XP_021592766.1 uncharacterized protein LOC110600264 [Manihot esculenta]XP_043806687.1 uncharacterized protein LOC110600264 [Manihot esculenta]XP_043806688.1 uncharacterized protein LOC110600264 [Manihot esculenta]KAG8639109.1 hypothetical protein MANES_14G102800v8 [Manihot esculenta]KAG8639110.1 hypothetical protein MANES_14G102800v8 [Manihot esculenta]OAY31322.1 hypothetical protein MANES_14G102800v8 [Manihot esculenta]